MIKATDFSFVTKRINKELKDATNRVIDSNWYILGEEVKNFDCKKADEQLNEFCALHRIQYNVDHY